MMMMMMMMMMTTFRQRQNIRSRTLYRKFLLTQRDKFCSREVEATKSFYLMTLDARNKNNFGCFIFQAVMMTMLSSQGQRPRSLALLSSGLLQGGDLGQFRGGVTSRKRTPPPLPLPPVQQCTMLGSNGENRLRDRASCAWYALAAGARSRNLVFKF